MKNATKGKGVITAAVHESTSARKSINSPIPPLLLGVQKQLVTDSAKAFITIERIICRRGKPLPHNVTKGESEKNWDEAIEAEAGT